MEYRRSKSRSGSSLPVQLINNPVEYNLGRVSALPRRLKVVLTADPSSRKAAARHATPASMMVKT